MDEQSLIKASKSNRIQLSLSAVMFFSPFIQNIVGNANLELVKEDLSFVKWYIKLGYFNIILLIISIAFGTMSYFYDYLMVVWIYKIAVFILIGLLVMWILWIVTDINILWWEKKFFQYKEITNDKTNILFWFFPIYNIFMWYKVHTFDSPYRRAKESILRWLLFVLVALITKSAWISSLILVLIIIRIVSLLSGIDLISDEIKKKVNKVFYKNPEEIRWYVSGWISFVIKKLALHSSLDNETQLNLDECIKDEKKKYEGLYTFQIENKLYIQYGILTLFLWMQIYVWILDSNQWIYIIPGVMIWLRYAVMYRKWKHLPNLPLLKEFIDLLYYLEWFAKIYIKKLKDFYLSKK